MGGGGEYEAVVGEYVAVGGEYVAVVGEYVAVVSEYMAVVSEYVEGGGEYVAGGGEHETGGGEHEERGGEKERSHVPVAACACQSPGCHSGSPRLRAGARTACCSPATVGYKLDHFLASRCYCPLFTRIRLKERPSS